MCFLNALFELLTGGYAQKKAIEVQPNTEKMGAQKKAIEVQPNTEKMGASDSKVVVCYISSWAVHRTGRGKYTIKNFDPSLCTHAIYAFAGIDLANATIKSLDPLDLRFYDTSGKGGYETLTGLKSSHPHLKVSLAIGGANQGSKEFSPLAADPELRKRFAKNAVVFLREYNFDGLDLDWEYPTQEGGTPNDRQNFFELVKELRQEFVKDKLLLTAAISANKNTFEKAYDLKNLSEFLDYVHVMCYDYNGSWNKCIGFNAPYAASNWNGSVKETIEEVLELGIPAQKLVMGLAFYGRTFMTFGQGAKGEATDGSSFQGPYTKEDGFMGYNEICEKGWTKGWDDTASQRIDRSTRDRNGQISVVTYDDARAIEIKVKFAVSKGLGGVMVWSVDTDDFLGDSGEKYPLLKAVKKALST